MAKKKTKAEPKINPAIDASLIKEFGEGIFVSGQSIIDKPYTLIPVSPAIDMMLGGGIPEGSFGISTGPPKVGKTTLWLDFAGTAQGMAYANDFCPDGRHVYFFNVEGRIKPRDLSGIKNLDVSSRWFTSIQSEVGNILTAEKYLSICEHLINTRPGAIFIIDSFSQLCSQARKDGSYADRFRDDVPLMLANFCKRVSNVLPVNRSLLLGVTHRLANQGNSKSAWMEASGQKVQYQLDVKLEAPWREFVPKKSDNPYGQIVHWRCHSSALGPPNRKAQSLLRYGHGLDKEWELINIAKDVGLVKTAGTWFTFPSGDKAQGIDNAAEYVRQHGLYPELNKQFREMMGLPIV